MYTVLPDDTGGVIVLIYKSQSPAVFIEHFQTDRYPGEVKGVDRFVTSKIGKVMGIKRVLLINILFTCPNDNKTRCKLFIILNSS